MMVLKCLKWLAFQDHQYTHAADTTRQGVCGNKASVGTEDEETAELHDTTRHDTTRHDQDTTRRDTTRHDQDTRHDTIK